MKEGVLMDRTAYKNQFNAEHYERINFSVPVGMKQVIKDLASKKGMSMNKYFLHLVMKDQECLFDNMQLAEKSREKILTIKGNTHDGYDVFLKMEELFIAELNWKSENVLHKTIKVLHKTPDFVLLFCF